jgi:hypothetical protein
LTFRLRMAVRQKSPKGKSYCAQIPYANALLGGRTCDGREGNSRQRPARDSRNAAISWPLRTSRTSPASAGWFQVLPSSAGNRATSVNCSGVALTSASSPSSASTSSNGQQDELVQALGHSSRGIISLRTLGCDRGCTAYCGCVGSPRGEQHIPLVKCRFHHKSSQNDQADADALSSATRPTRGVACNRPAMAGFAAAHS